ncbi:YCF48-related protein [Pelomonas aquatica]|jgi:photosystem II stability/assembly factor-like uncharacterized protein|uniref:Glycosyl hydrolase n=1 Tax=Pelomonas aquatica TaxID=431058 RepID=A0A9X4LKQ3_9BURK|nr:YCF48-related protein [Pelomonas aquatica]MCY4757143.1 YCF48-related protein [Pelomonas aquatica]MDG0864579.1 glycosyl hydrolase [Pelomonas aquatica]
MTALIRLAALSFVFSLGGSAASAANEPAGSPLLELRPNAQPPAIARSLLLGLTRAGSRVVAVGEQGLIELSDDDGKTFRAAKSVPVQVTLTAVHFADASHGWAVGHLGVILATTDGGETWTLQRQDVGKDQPLLSVFFLDGKRGIAVGLWSLLLTTEDGGGTWSPVKVPPPAGASRADRNLFHAFGDAQGQLYVTSESGQVLRSTDGGHQWSYLATGYNGSLWAGTALPNGALVVGGLRGSLFRSDDHGATWRALPLEEKRSITSLVGDGTGGVYGAGIDGLFLRSADGIAFSSSRLPGRPTLTAVLVTTGGGALLISSTGPVAPPAQTK